MRIPDAIMLEAIRKIAFGDLGGARELLDNYEKGGDDNVCTQR